MSLAVQMTVGLDASVMRELDCLLLVRNSVVQMFERSLRLSMLPLPKRFLGELLPSLLSALCKRCDRFDTAVTSVYKLRHQQELV